MWTLYLSRQKKTRITIYCSRLVGCYPFCIAIKYIWKRWKYVFVFAWLRFSYLIYLQLYGYDDNISIVSILLSFVGAVLEQWRLKDLTWTCLPTETADKHFPETEKDRDNCGEGGGAWARVRCVTHPGSFGTSAGDPISWFWPSITLISELTELRLH